MGRSLLGPRLKGGSGKSGLLQHSILVSFGSVLLVASLGYVALQMSDALNESPPSDSFAAELEGKVGLELGPVEEEAPGGPRKAVLEAPATGGSPVNERANGAPPADVSRLATEEGGGGEASAGRVNRAGMDGALNAKAEPGGVEERRTSPKEGDDRRTGGSQVDPTGTATSQKGGTGGSQKGGTGDFLNATADGKRKEPTEIGTGQREGTGGSQNGRAAGKETAHGGKKGPTEVGTSQKEGKGGSQKAGADGSLKMTTDGSWKGPAGTATSQEVGQGSRPRNGTDGSRAQGTGGSQKEEPRGTPAKSPQQALPARNTTAIAAALAKLPDPVDFWKPLPPGAVPRDNYAAVCGIVRADQKEEQEDLREWVLHHRYYFGMKTYVYDHKSSTPLDTVLADYVQRGDAEVIPLDYPFDGHPVPQVVAYDRCLNLTKGRHKWVALIDADEFIWQSEYWKAQPFRNFMQQFEDAGALAVSWTLYCSSGHVARPKGVRRSYTVCKQGVGGFKSITRPEVSTRGVNTHWYNHTGGLYTVDEKHQRVTSLYPWASVLNITLNHYWGKSKEDFAMKHKRGNGAGYSYGWEYFKDMNKWCFENCTFLAALRV